MSGMDRYAHSYTVNRIISGKTKIGCFVASAGDPPRPPRLSPLLQGYLGQPAGPSNVGYVPPPNTWQEQGEEQDKMQQRFLGGIAAISPGVGGIGIRTSCWSRRHRAHPGDRYPQGHRCRAQEHHRQFNRSLHDLQGIGGLFGIAAGYIGTLIVGKLSFKMILWPSPSVAVGSFFISVALASSSACTLPSGLRPPAGGCSGGAD